jgi:aldehyde dehydrogenase (NAD+)
MKSHKDELAECVAKETGKKLSDASGEVSAAIMQAEFFASEGMRLYGQSLNSSVVGKTSFTVRQPHGIAALIVPANTPIANISWKIFPALICGNTVVLKSSEDAPEVALLMGKISRKSGLANGVLNVIHGKGENSGARLVDDSRIKIISFTGSTEVGKKIAESANKRLARLSLELGGKNPLVVCNDADIDNAVKWAVLSAFSNAGQRCASGSRLIVFKQIYDKFKEKFINATNKLKLGIDKDCDLGPVINKKQYTNIIKAIENSKLEGGTILCGGVICDKNNLSGGYYIEPTLIEGLKEDAFLNQNEIFGPVTSITMVKDLVEALNIANNSHYGLTSSIHTKNIDNAIWFAKNVNSGVANINFGTYGSEPHMPFGGFGLSGNGSREPGTEAINVYSELKNISILSVE